MRKIILALLLVLPLFAEAQTTARGPFDTNTGPGSVMGTGGAGGGFPGQGSSYVLPPATASTLGGVKPDGTTTTVAPDGTISAVGGGSAGVSSFMTRTGAVSLLSADVAAALGYVPLAPAAIPAATGALLGGSGTAGTAGAVAVGSGLALTAGTLSATGTARTVATGLTAAGTTQGTALALTADDSIVTTVAAGAGVQLRAANGQRVVNRGANPLLVYPVSAGTIEAAAANMPVTLVAGGAATFTTGNGSNFYAE